MSVKVGEGKSCSFTEAFLNLLFPLFCVTCGKLLKPDNRTFLCSDCLSEIKRIRSPVCEKCGKPDCTALCRECRKTNRYYSSARAAGIYDGVLRECIHKFKYRKEQYLARTLAGLMVDSLEEFRELLECALIVPVPLHRVRERERGFNQAHLLAERIKDALNGLPKIDISSGNLRRVRGKTAQTDLSRSLRLSNVKGIFAVEDSSEFAGEEILLIDDVFTTGSTVNECSKVLIEAGAKKVHVLTAARGE